MRELNQEENNQELNNEDDIMRELTQEEMEITGGACMGGTISIGLSIKANQEYKINELLVKARRNYGASYNFESYNVERYEIATVNKISGTSNYKFEIKNSGLYLIARRTGAFTGKTNATYQVQLIRRWSSGNDVIRVRFRVY